MNYQNDQEDSVLEEKPVLLKVLCILTFIGSSFIIISSIFSYQSAGKLSEIFHDKKGNTVSTDNQTRPLTKEDSVLLRDSLKIPDSILSPKVSKEDEMERKMENTVVKMMEKDSIEKKAISDFIAALFTLGGAILMWRQKRIGFYSYIAGTVISIAGTLMIYGNDLLIMGWAVMMGIVGLVFITLYALNWKALR